MPAVRKQPITPNSPDLALLLPSWVEELGDLQTAIPQLAKNAHRMAELDALLPEVPTLHRSVRGNARELRGLANDSVHLVLTSPPYWNLKEYRDSTGQLGHIDDYMEFLAQLDTVWQRCFDALVPGGRLICVVGDVCLSRRKIMAATR